MTFDQIIEAAKSRAFDFGANFPTTSLTLYRRIEIRESEIFGLANRANPDYFGKNLVGTLTARGDFNLATIDAAGSTVDPASTITKIEIEDPGTHPTFQCGDKVTIISHTDPDAGISPRVWLRNFVVHGYKTDLDGVVSLCVYYGYRPAPRTLPYDGTETSELPSVYQELLVIDLIVWMLRQSLSMDTEKKAAALGLLTEEETQTMAGFMAEVEDYSGGQVSRFGSVVGGQRT